MRHFSYAAQGTVPGCPDRNSLPRCVHSHKASRSPGALRWKKFDVSVVPFQVASISQSLSRGRSCGSSCIRAISPAPWSRYLPEETGVKSDRLAEAGQVVPVVSVRQTMPELEICKSRNPEPGHRSKVGRVAAGSTSLEGEEKANFARVDSSSSCASYQYIKTASCPNSLIIMACRQSENIKSSSHSSRHHRKMPMDMLDAAITWTPKTGKADDPVQVSGLGILPAVSMDSSKHSIAMSDCCHLRDWCEVQYYNQTISAVAGSSRSKCRKEDTTMVIKSKPHGCCEVVKSTSCHRSVLG